MSACGHRLTALERIFRTHLRPGMDAIQLPYIKNVWQF